MNNNDMDEMREWLLLSMVGGADLAADVIERRGQTRAVYTETLPKDMRGVSRAQLEAAGFTFGEDVDDLFVWCVLPEGWKKERTDHNMWSKLVDPNGIERGSIFYKAAFYDRDAFLSMTGRFTIKQIDLNADGTESDNPFRADMVAFAVRDSLKNEITRVGDPVGYEDWTGQDRASAETRAFLVAHRPDWENPLAYWDDETASAE